jgi:hypothetical protein
MCLHPLVAACERSLCSPANFVTLFVGRVWPCAVAAAEIGRHGTLSYLRCTTTLPLPPCPGLPLDPPSQKPILIAPSLCQNFLPRSSAIQWFRLASVTCMLAIVLRVTGSILSLYRSYASLTVSPHFVFCNVVVRRSSACTLSTFHRHIAVMVTVTPTVQSSVAVFCTSSHSSIFSCCPHFTTYSGT